MSDEKKGLGERLGDELTGCFAWFIDVSLLIFLFHNYTEMEGDMQYLGGMILAMYMRYRFKVFMGWK